MMQGKHGKKQDMRREEKEGNTLHRWYRSAAVIFTTTL